MASFPRAKVDSSTQTDPPLPFTALLDRTLDRIEANVPLNLSSVTFHIRRHHLARIEQLERVLSNNFFFKFVLFRIGLSPQHVFSILCLVFLVGCRQLYKKSVYLTTNICAVAYPAYCSIRTINSEAITPPKELGLAADLATLGASSTSGYTRRHRHPYGSGSYNSASSSFRSITSDHPRRGEASLGSNSYSSSQEEYESRSEALSWRPGYSNYSEDNMTTTSGSLTVEERMKQRMRRRWEVFSRSRKEKATRQWLAYWSIYGTVQVVDTWSSFLLDWIPGYNLGKLMFLWWAQRRGATLIFDYFRPLIQAKSKDGREVARKNRSLNSDTNGSERRGRRGREDSSSGRGGTTSAASSVQMLPSMLTQQQFYGQSDADHNQHAHEQHRKAMTSSPHDSGSFANTSLFESAESVWTAPSSSPSVHQLVDTTTVAQLGRLHSNNATPTPMSVREQYQRRQQQQLQVEMAHQAHQDLDKEALHPYAMASTIYWSPPSSIEQ
ncbi:hypothetical protein MVEG_06886 [Podila verticillata NRRL 6337]|nr:hypothetical protein MVEG_06886 [Podila verticillata NRRL 6337]